MYRVSVPIIVTSSTFDASKVIEDMKLMGADRVFLSIDFLSHDKTVMDGYYSSIEKAIPKFKAENIEVGIWFWTFRFANEEPRYTVMVNSLGEKCHTTTVKYCPLDEGYLSFMEEHVKRLASMHPDLIMFDDDLAFGFTSMKAPSCFCHLHRKKMAEYLDGEIPDVEGLYEKMFSGKKNKYRSSFMNALGESLKNFAKRMRDAVDSVDANVRMGACGCITTFDYDGVDSFTLSKILAGNTKPFLRLIGAPYWDPVRLHGNYLCDVIELERMERAWYNQNDIEIFSEGDTYPRPRHRVPASYLEIFDAALRADNNLDGILKYTFCYSNHAEYERGYINAHIRNRADVKKIEDTFAKLSDSGVRVYETMRKIENSDYSNDNLTVDLIRYQFFSRAIRFLAHNSIPIAHRGSGCAGIVFGENARDLDLRALEKPLILDEHAARILIEKGIDVGIKSFEERFTPTAEHFIKTDEFETVTDYGHKPSFASRILPCNSVKVESEWIAPNGERLPASFSYKNSSGNVFLVFCMDAFTSADEIYKNYSRQKQIFDFLESNTANVPAKCIGNPDLYIICKENDDSLAIALFNCFADSISDFAVDLSTSYSSAEFSRACGRFEGNKLYVDHLGAFDWCYIALKK